jgi:hypothetical protein
VDSWLRSHFSLKYLQDEIFGLIFQTKIFCSMDIYVRNEISVVKYWHKAKLKLSRYRPGQTLGVPGGWYSRISRQSAHEGCKVFSPTHRPSLPPLLISVRDWVDPRATMRPEGLSHCKIPVIPSEIETATFRLVAQCLNQLRHRVPPTIDMIYRIS